MKSAAQSLFLLLLAHTCFLSAQTAPAEHKPAASKGAADPFLNGAPFSFEQVLRLAGEDAIPLRRRKDAIQSRGVDFSLSPEKLDKLKAAGAPEELLKLIKSKAKPGAVSHSPAAHSPAPHSPAPLSPAPEPPLGSVAVACAPAECDVSLNGTLLGPTEDGRIELAKLRPGSWAIDFKKDGYVSQQSMVTVEADRTQSVSVVLDPDRATQEAFGAELFRQMVEAIGDADGLQQLASVQVTGSATLAARDGKSIRWTLLMRNRPDRALFQLRAGGILHELAFIGSKYETSKNLKGADALDLPTGFGLVRDNQLSALIARLQNPQFKMLANHEEPVDGEEFTLFAEDGAEKVSIGLDSELRPQRVRITTAAGVGSVVVSYSDYCEDEKVTYPKAMQIKPEGWQQGIDVRFDTVTLSPNLNDNDYKLKGKALANLGN